MCAKLRKHKEDKGHAPGLVLVQGTAGPGDIAVAPAGWVLSKRTLSATAMGIRFLHFTFSGNVRPADFQSVMQEIQACSGQPSAVFTGIAQCITAHAVAD